MVSWRRESGTFLLDIDVPPPINAAVHLPRAEAYRVNGGSLQEAGTTVVTQQDGVVVEVKDGRHRFEARSDG